MLQSGKEMGWKVGDQLQGGKYEITDVLGDGSFGTVYKAKFVQIDRVVVIKTPLEKFKNYPDYRKLVTALKNEGEKLKQLSTYNHPNIVQVGDVFEEIDTYCIWWSTNWSKTKSALKSFSPQHGFLILLASSWIGLRLGWMLILCVEG